MIQELQPGDSVLLSHGKASCRAQPGCQSGHPGSQQSWDMASLIMLLPATLALDKGEPCYGHLKEPEDLQWLTRAPGRQYTARGRKGGKVYSLLAANKAE